MKKIFLSAGHSNTKGRDRGASGNGYIEGELTVELRNLIVIELRKLGITPIVDSDNSIFSETVNFFRNRTTKDCIVVDLHWNAATPQATGTETLIPAQHTKFERELAQAISEVIGQTLSIPLRGVKGVKTELESHHGRLAWMRLTGENILPEICFITNSRDMSSYQQNKRLLAERIANVLYEFAREKTSQTTTHVVSSGETLWSISRRYNIPVEDLKRNNSIGSNITIGQTLKIK